MVDAKLQRDALGMLEEHVFSDKPFQFPPELYNQLGWSNWNHWGMRAADAARILAFTISCLQWQDRILAQLLSPLTLKRMHDAELKAAADADALTTAELIERLTKAIFSEVEIDQGRRVHQPQAGDQQPAAEPAAVVPEGAVEAGPGHIRRAAGLPDGRLCRADQPAAADQEPARQPAGRQQARHLQPGPPAGIRGPDRQGAGRPV